MAMAFKIDEEIREGITFLIMKNEISGESVELIPQLGATVNKLSLRAGSEVRNILFCDRDAELRRNPLFRGRILFPFNDCIPSGVYTFDNITCNFPVNNEADGMAIHGYVYNKPFIIVDKKCDTDYCRVSMRLSFSASQVQGYPFALALTLVFTLSEQQLHLRFIISNTGKTKAPLSFGWHPYFTFNNNLDQTTLKIAADKYIEIDNTHLPTRRIPECTGTEFDFRDGKSIASICIDNAVTAPADGCSQLSNGHATYTLRQDTSFFKYVQIYMPEDKKSIAIEPVTAAPNNFNFTELGLITIAPGQTIDTFASVSVS